MSGSGDSPFGDCHRRSPKGANNRASQPRSPYSLEVQSARAVTATVWGQRPTKGVSLAVTYDAFDHATSLNDGTTTISEVLAPSGRVLSRTVTLNATGQTIESTTFGYSDSSDTPAYSTSAGVTTTYGPGGAVHVPGQASSWPVTNLHGDVVATVAADGTITQVPLTDEFGVAYQGDGRDPKRPDSRLGWLGGPRRYNIGDRTGIIRMGVRLYSPTLGRFLQVDPVEGGSADDYDYVEGDPVNDLDLAGTFGFKKFFKKMKNAGRWLYRHTEVSVGLCVVRCIGLGMQGGTVYRQTGWGCCFGGLNVGVAHREYRRRSCDTVGVTGQVGPVGAYGEMGVYKSRGRRRMRPSRGISNSKRLAPSLDLAGGWSGGLGAGAYAVTNVDLLGHRVCR